MEKTHEESFHDVEEKHWWLVAKRKLVAGFVEKMPKDAVVLEVGCGGGLFVKQLRNMGFTVAGIDLSKKAIEKCRSRGIINVSIGDAKKTGFVSNMFDLVVALDILEHIDDEAAVLAEWKRVIRPGGKLIVFVPAFNFLWSSQDVVWKHFRRYNKKSLNRALAETGFVVERSGYWNFSLFFPSALLKLLQPASSGGKDQLFFPGNILNGFFKCLLFLENWVILKGMHFPFGTTVFAIVKNEVKQK